MFSDAISSISWRCRPSSPRIAAAISGSASVSGAVKNESGAEAVLALLGEELMINISTAASCYGPCGRSHVAVERVIAGYHIARQWPSACGTRLIFMQDMVGWRDSQHPCVPGSAVSPAPPRRLGDPVAVIDIVAELDHASGGRPGRDIDPVQRQRLGDLGVLALA